MLENIPREKPQFISIEDKNLKRKILVNQSENEKQMFKIDWKGEKASWAPHELTF